MKPNSLSVQINLNAGTFVSSKKLVRSALYFIFSMCLFLFSNVSFAVDSSAPIKKNGKFQKSNSKDEKAKGRNQDFVLPKGWRNLNNTELKEEWRASEVNNFATVKEDFNGDDKKDVAQLLVKSDKNDFGIFVWFNGEEKQEPRLVFAEGKYDPIHFMGIDSYKPGHYATVCGKGYMACGKGEPEAIDLNYSAIDYFKEGSANSVFIWNQKEKKFDRIWMSD